MTRCSPFMWSGIRPAHRWLVTATPLGGAHRRRSPGSGSDQFPTITGPGRIRATRSPVHRRVVHRRVAASVGWRLVDAGVACSGRTMGFRTQWAIIRGWQVRCAGAPGCSSLPATFVEKSIVPCVVRLNDRWVTGLSANRFYGDLASWWPLISPVDEYVEEAGLIAQLLGSAAIPVREVLELGSGGGSNAAHLKQQFKLTLVDLSPEMLQVSQQLNPECVHQQGDMRTVRIGREFDAVFVHDAVGYMTSEDDLTAAARTAFLHCRPGGVAVFVPDEIRESYEPGTEQGGTDGPDGRGVRFLEWSWDPDPADTTTVTQYVFVLRDPDNAVHVVHEEHRFGLFDRQTWLDVLTAAGFQVEVTLETTDDDRTPRELFLAHRPVA
jgi:trans-aconitate methyltransferase